MEKCIYINRKDFPADLQGVTLQVGKARFCQSDFLTAVVWQNKRPVHVISTLSQQQSQCHGGREMDHVVWSHAPLPLLHIHNTWEE